MIFAHGSGPVRWTASLSEMRCPRPHVKDPRCWDPTTWSYQRYEEVDMRHRFLLLSAAMVLGTLAGTANAYYPKSVLVEMGTATW